MDTDLYTVAVRELCEFAAKAGDLDTRFTPAPTALEGNTGHSVVAARRGAARQAEVHLSATIGKLLVRGRADGYDAERGLLDEVKTFKGDLNRMPPNHRALHWAQAKVYAALLCAQLKLPALRVALIYFEVGTQKETTQKETTLEETWRAPDLSQFLAALCEQFWRWAQQELAHRKRRDECLSALAFPLADFRNGQRTLAVHVYKAAIAGRCLASEAGTGIGKTMGTLFPVLKAMPAERLDKVYFLTAKSTGHAAPLDTLNQLRRSSPAMPLRVLELVARTSACEHPGSACHGEACPLAHGFYDKLPAARQTAVLRLHLSREVVREVALQHQVCPYYLSQELVRWADVVVADYNYYFDSSALLHAMTVANEWRVAALIDEAHNLVERGRSMYTAELPREKLRAAIRHAPPAMAAQLRRVQRAWSASTKGQTQAYRSFGTVPTKLATSMRDACSRIGDLLADAAAAVPSTVLDLYFDLLHFIRLMESFGSHSVFEVRIEHGRRPSHLCIRNVVPAPFLAPRIRAARTCILFSATLSPRQYYADTLGLPSDTVWLELEPPFASDQLAVTVVRHISTRFQSRERSWRPIARLIGVQFERTPGNYLAFFSSFDYLEKVMRTFAEEFPNVRVWSQRRGMSEAARKGFLNEFAPGLAGVGFAVLGGVFSEGVDLPGERLIGAFIATLGLPQVNPVNEMMKDTLQATFGAGYNYAYLFPGMRKVIQAAGRVVRTPTDTGVLYLIDDRYRRREIQQLLPRWWRCKPLPAGQHEP